MTKKRVAFERPEYSVQEVTPLDTGDEEAPLESGDTAKFVKALEGIVDILPPKEVEEEKPYTEGWWKGLRQWKCKQCPWDTLEGEAEMLEHIRAVHVLPKSETGILVADKSGRIKT